MGDSEYAIFLDHDDVWKPKILASLVTALQCNPSAVGAYCIAERIDAEGKSIDPGAFETFMRMRLYIDERGIGLLPQDAPTGLESLAITNFIPSPGMALLRRSTLAKVGEWNSSLAHAEDYEMWLRLALIGEFFLVNSMMFGYRQHGANSSNNLSDVRKGLLLVRKQLMAHPGVTTKQRRIMLAGYRFDERGEAEDKIRQVPGLVKQGKFKDAFLDMWKAAFAIWRSVAGIHY